MTEITLKTDHATLIYTHLHDDQWKVEFVEDGQREPSHNISTEDVLRYATGTIKSP